jgi:hypothetical protein
MDSGSRLYRCSSFFAQDTPPINASFWVAQDAPPLSQVEQLWHIKWMGVHLSIKAKLVLTASERKELKFALEELNRACNTLSELAFQQDLHLFQSQTDSLVDRRSALD